MRSTVVSMMYAPSPPYNILHNDYGIQKHAYYFDDISRTIGCKLPNGWGTL